MTNLVVPVGMPGSGKSTWGRTMFGDSYNIVCSDDIRRRIWGSLVDAHDCTPEEKKERNEIVWKEFYDEVEDYLSFEENVYADGTNLRDFARAKLLDIALRTNTQPHVIFFDNAKQAWERNTKREEDKHVPYKVMTEFQRRFDDSKVEIFFESWTTRTLIGSLD